MIVQGRNSPRILRPHARTVVLNITAVHLPVTICYLFCCRMPPFKISFLFLVVLLSFSCARHLETETDNGGEDELSTHVRREGTKVSTVNDPEQRTVEQSKKRQDDIPGIWGRSVQRIGFPLTLDPILTALQKNQQNSRDKENVESDEDEEDDFKQPGLWGREIKNHESDDKESDEKDEDKYVRPPGLWGRGIQQNPPGLWGRGMQNNQPPGLWGRGIKHGPAPGLWGRGIQNSPPGLWGRGIQNNPPGLWGRDIKIKTPGLWERSLAELDTEDMDININDKK